MAASVHPLLPRPVAGGAAVKLHLLLHTPAFPYCLSWPNPVRCLLLFLASGSTDLFFPLNGTRVLREEHGWSRGSQHSERPWGRTAPLCFPLPLGTAACRPPRAAAPSAGEERPRFSFLEINQECSRDRAVRGLLASGAASTHLGTEQLPTRGGGGKWKRISSVFLSIRRWGSDLRPLIGMNEGL